MSRGATKAAQNQLNTTNALGSGAQERANSIYGTLGPELTGMATNPVGFNPRDVSSMETASAQGAGGATGGLTGQDILTSARTKNSATQGADLDKAARTSGQNVDQETLAVQGANALQKQQQQQYALSALGNLYGTNVGESESMYGMGPSTINAWTNAAPGWAQTIGGLMSDAGKLGQGVGAAATGING